MSGFLTRVFNGERRAESLSNPSAAMIEAILGGEATATGLHVTPDNAMRSTVVFACVRILSETVATLPLILYRRLARGKERAVDHYLYDKLHDAPNPEMSSFTFRETLTSHVCLWGNAFAELQLDGAGRVAAMWPLSPQTRIMRDRNNELVYSTPVPNAGYQGLPAYRVLHIRGLGNGIVGLSPIALARQAVGLALATEEYGARYFGNGAQPGIVLKHPGKLDDEPYKRLQASWAAAHQGLSNSHRAAILEEGMGIEKIGIPPEDSQFIESRKFQAIEIARLFRIQPHLIGDLESGASYASIEQQGLEFVTYTMAPWLGRWEQEISRSLLLERERREFFAEFLVDGLLRGDITARYAAYTSAINTGWMTRNEAREKENMNPNDATLDGYLRPLNMANEGQA